MSFSSSLSGLPPTPSLKGETAAVMPQGSEEVAIKISHLSKLYQLYEKPGDRLKQMLIPRLQRLFFQESKQFFKEFWAIRDISFEVRRGETLGIVGRNGAGKSTLLQIICGTLTPTSGDVQINGRVAALLELGSGFNPEFTGRENVFLNASVLGLTREQTFKRLDDILSFADIGDFIDQPVKTYSSGMMVRLAFAVIAHVDADILVIDEALAVGDAFFTQKCMRFLRSFMTHGTVLFVSHDTGSVKSLCNRALWIEKGKTQLQGSPKEVCELYLEAFYEAQQGKSSSTQLKPGPLQDQAAHFKDQRQDFLNHSNLRNDLEVFRFDPFAPSFGKGDAQIIQVDFLDSYGSPLSWIVGGEEVTLRVCAKVHETLLSPIIGFHIKDRLGQTLFGDNTYLTYANQLLQCESHSTLCAEFSFSMPILPNGNYSVNVAIATGSQAEHIQHHWIHDAILFKSESSSVSTGLVGIPMQKISLRLL